MLDPIDKAVIELLPEPPEMSETAYAAGLDRLHTATSGASVFTAAPSSARQLSRRRFLPLAAAAAALGVIGTGVVVTSRGSGERVQPAGFTDPVLGRGQYFYTRKRAEMFQPPGARSLVVTELWTPANRRDDWKMSVQVEPDTISGNTLVGSANKVNSIDGILFKGRGPQEVLDSLPHDPAGIRALLETLLPEPSPDSSQLPGPPGGMFTQVVVLLLTPAPAELRSPLLQVLRQLPGVVVDENARTPDNKQAIGFTGTEHSSSGLRSAGGSTVYVAPDTGRVIAALDYAEPGDVQPWARTTVTYAVVDGMEARP